jgi:heme exporter protein B
VLTAWRDSLRLAARDIAVEASGREAATAVIPLVAAAVLLAGLGFGPRPDVLTTVAPGLSWLVVLFAAVPLARGVAAAERSEGCWDLLRAVVTPASLWAGKILALWLWLLVTWALATVLSLGLFGAELAPATLLAGPLGTLGLATLTVAFGVLLAAAERRNGLLGVLLLPAGLPALLAGVQVSTLGAGGWRWLALLVAYDLVTLAAAWAVFPVLLEE